MAFISIALGIIVAVAGSGVAAQTQAQQTEPIRANSISHEIRFPDEIIFHLDATSDSEITEVEFFYNLGIQNSRTYGYPEFTPSRNINGNFRLKTSGSSYIPPGVEVEYFYVIRNSLGNELETEKTSFEYLDPSFDWQRLTVEELIVLWHDRPRDQVMDVANEVNRELEDVKNLLGLDSVKPQKAVILLTGQEADRNFPPISEAATRGHLFGGFAFGDFDVFVLAGLDKNGIVHEMTHLYINEAINSSLARVPSWLNEGLAMYFESGSGGRDRIVLQASVTGSLLPLASMDNVPGRPEGVRIFYAQSWSVVTHMMDNYGDEKMSGLLALINEGESVDSAALTIYGKSLDEIDREWRLGLARSSRLSRLPDPGSVGTSAIIGAAAGLAMLIVAFRRIRRIFSPPNTEDTEA